MVAEWLLPEFNTEIVDEWLSPEMRYHNRVPPARYSLRSPLGDEFRHRYSFFNNLTPPQWKNGAPEM